MLIPLINAYRIYFEMKAENKAKEIPDPVKVVEQPKRFITKKSVRNDIVNWFIYDEKEKSKLNEYFNSSQASSLVFSLNNRIDWDTSERYHSVSYPGSLGKSPGYQLLDLHKFEVVCWFADENEAKKRAFSCNALLDENFLELAKQSVSEFKNSERGRERYCLTEDKNYSSWIKYDKKDRKLYPSFGIYDKKDRKYMVFLREYIPGYREYQSQSLEEASVKAHLLNLIEEGKIDTKSLRGKNKELL